MHEFGLGRRPEFDERSRNFPITAHPLVAGVGPRSFTWALNTVLDQGSVGSCVGHAWAHELAAKPVVVQGVGSATALAIYHRAQQLDEWPGEYPAYEGTSVLAGAKATAEMGRLVEYRWAFGVDELARGVSRAGPAVIGVSWHRDMFDPGADGYVRPTGDVVGGHAILVRGYSVSKRRFLLHNSWGTRFGGKGGAPPGCAWIDHDDLGALLQAGGDACLPVRRML